MKGNNRTCDCCGKELEYYFSGQRFCNSCSVSHSDYRKEVFYYKGKLSQLKKKYYELKWKEKKKK